MKIYTKTGDDGTTGLFGGQRVSKSDPRVECTGSVDELNAAIGCAVVEAPPEIRGRLRIVQNELFVVGSILGCPDGSPPASVPALDESSVARLEMEIDAIAAGLPPLRNFILPGGTESSARLHLARTVCRRAERVLVAFSHDRPIPPVVLTYLNRLGDWLFAQARSANRAAGVDDILWTNEP